MNITNLESSMKGAIVGSLIGDSLGYPYTNKKTLPSKVRFITGPSGEAPGTYQGPSTLMLCTMDSMNEFKFLDTGDIMEKFNDFLIAGYLGSSENCSDLSDVTISALKHYNNGMPPDRCGMKTNNDGECLARILPIALHSADEHIDVIVEKAHLICDITHSETLAKVACAVYCLIVKTILKQKPEKVFDLLADYYATRRQPDYLKQLELLRSGKDNVELMNKNTIIGCFWSAWTAYSQFEDDFKLCVTSAIASYPQDANTVGSIAGGLSGLSCGIRQMPTEWLNFVVLSSDAMKVIQKFIDNVVKKIKLHSAKVDL